MSRAFVKETDAAAAALPDRPVSAHPNLVTPEGLTAIERAVAAFTAAQAAAAAAGNMAAVAAAARELRYWTARRASAQVVPRPYPSPHAGEGTAQPAPAARATMAAAGAPDAGRVVTFGATVTVRRHDGRDGAGRTQTFRIVGEDEAEPARGTLSHVAPLARALFGKAVGDSVDVAGGTAEILAIG